MSDDRPPEESPPDPEVPLVDWVVTARRVGRSALVLLALALAAWMVRAVVVGRWSFGDLGNLVGLALAASVVTALVVVGGSALRGMLRAGERGERLSSADVGLLPPVRRRRRRNGSAGSDEPPAGDDEPDVGNEQPPVE